MLISKEYDFNDLKNMVWEGAKNTLEEIDKADKGDELMEYLETYYDGRVPTKGEVNDLLWWKGPMVLADLGIE